MAGQGRKEGRKDTTFGALGARVEHIDFDINRVRIFCTYLGRVGFDPLGAHPYHDVGVNFP